MEYHRRERTHARGYIYDWKAILGMNIAGTRPVATATDANPMAVAGITPIALCLSSPQTVLRPTRARKPKLVVQVGHRAAHAYQ